MAKVIYSNGGAFRTEVECENVHQLVANLGQSEGELARRYVDYATELLDHLTAMQPNNKVFGHVYGGSFFFWSYGIMHIDGKL